MIGVIKHRGPDGEGYFTDNNIGLGHCYLATLNLPQWGKQPMINEQKNLWIIYDGEVYNFLDLREKLEKLGHKFKSNTDTEVILHGYEQWGTDCLNKLNGKWAFAIWDKKKRELFCSRDRFGIKPLYYFSDGGSFYFASEIKSLLELNIPRRPNDALIYDFLKFDCGDHINETFFKDIKKLPAASWMKIKQNGEVAVKKYWDFEISSQIANDEKDKQEYAEEFLNLFVDSIKLRLRSRFPVGFLLSGGLDSSSIVCLASDLLKEKLITFSACFKEKAFDVRKYVEEIVAKTGSEKNYILSSPDDFLEECDNMLWHLEAPFERMSAVSFWKASKMASKKVKVLLSGEGGDENLCGYREYQVIYLRNLLENHQYGLFFNEFMKFLFPPGLFSIISGLVSGNISAESVFRQYPQLTGKFLGEEDLLNSQFRQKFQSGQGKKISYKKDLGQYIKETITTWRLPKLLNGEEKITMAHSVEIRYPFLDYRLVEKIASFPLNQKISSGWNKAILRKCMKGILPETVRMRKIRQAFDVPERTWFKTNLGKEVESIIRKSRFILDYADREKLLARLNNFPKIPFSGHRAFFKFYILELWAKKFLS